MKHDIKSSKPSFEPIEVTLTLESLEELKELVLRLSVSSDKVDSKYFSDSDLVHFDSESFDYLHYLLDDLYKISLDRS